MNNVTYAVVDVPKDTTAEMLEFTAVNAARLNPRMIVAETTLIQLRTAVALTWQESHSLAVFERSKKMPSIEGIRLKYMCQTERFATFTMLIDPVLYSEERFIYLATNTPNGFIQAVKLFYQGHKVDPRFRPLIDHARRAPQYDRNLDGLVFADQVIVQR